MRLIFTISRTLTLRSIYSIAAAVLLILSSSSVRAADEPIEADVIIYGGTSAGVAAAVQLDRMGKSSVIIEPSQHLGGLSAGGLGWTDSGNKSVIGGVSLEFYQRVKDEYDKEETWKWQDSEDYSRYSPDAEAIWVFEPHIAERVFNNWVKETKTPVYLGERLDLKDGVTVENGRITEIRMESGQAYRGKIFIDATYEGDLMAKAGVSYTVGREGNDVYGETLNGVQKARTVSHQFEHQISPYRIPGNPASGLLPGVHGNDPGEDGTGDHRVQAYCFRMCLSNHPDNRVPFPKPDQYDPERYELLARILDAGWNRVFQKFDVIPNRKTDTNNHGPFSTDNIGMNYDYPDGDYETREQIIEEHRNYQQGLMWFLANDPRIPTDIQTRIREWGLAADEFQDNGNWPHQIYVREARRMVSDFVMTEWHLRAKKPTPESIGMGSYNMDSHNVQRYVTEEGYARNEGDIQINPGGPYPVSYRAIVPPKKECENLLVPVCLSSSHIAYGSIRMEPVFMILAQSAATAASQSIDNNIAVQDVKYEDLQKKLLEDGQVLEYSGPRRQARTGIDPKSLEGIVIDNTEAKVSGLWQHSTSAPVFVGVDYLHNEEFGSPDKSVTFEFLVTEEGEYDVRLGYPPNPNRASNVTVEIESKTGTSSTNVNQKKTPAISNAFVSLGAYEFSPQSPGRVIIQTENANGYVIADAVWIVRVDADSNQ
ncbi:FAD-dependent oxidoreductase [Rubinisphaera margarita]|uniref:FAD-dependent oxidoreductase n=1 Tax=Rubinisphaera margarita TaxID=2909586 RepID=UPI001EE8F48C|nr:FAD-dependent oxidoreductase [Rubinisphaera margarita]MCG6154322.1 FAD-dependent oxidoreductase [Rubinisphaera margarita]